jgi:hypothetical protein
MIVSLIESYALFLADYRMEQIEKALKLYIKQKPDIPAPADLIKLITAGQYSRPESCPVIKKINDNSEKNRNSARKFAIELIKGFSGMQAEKEGYYTELFGYYYDTAFSQLQSCASIYVQDPEPIPSEWLVIGSYRKEAQNKPVRP